MFTPARHGAQHRTELRQLLGRLWGAASLRTERGPSGLGSDLTSESQDESQPSGSPSTCPQVSLQACCLGAVYPVQPQSSKLLSSSHTREDTGVTWPELNTEQDAPRMLGREP